MGDRIEVTIQMNGGPKTYMMSQIALIMLLECNEVIWPDFSETEAAFVVKEKAYFTSDGRLDKITLLMLSSLER